MPVEVRYHVIREGKGIAVYTSKKEADAHDKMLDIAEKLVEYIGQLEGIRIEDDMLDELCIHLSKNRDHVVRLLKGLKSSPKAASASSPQKTGTKTDATDSTPTVQMAATSGKGPRKKPSDKSTPVVPVKGKATGTKTKKRRKVATTKA